jgi:hypothetical protein
VFIGIRKRKPKLYSLRRHWVRRSQYYYNIIVRFFSFFFLFSIRIRVGVHLNLSRAGIVDISLEYYYFFFSTLVVTEKMYYVIVRSTAAAAATPQPPSWRRVFVGWIVYRAAYLILLYLSLAHALYPFYLAIYL